MEAVVLFVQEDIRDSGGTCHKKITFEPVTALPADADARPKGLQTFGKRLVTYRGAFGVGRAVYVIQSENRRKGK
jgi:hypothetical protein